MSKEMIVCLLLSEKILNVIAMYYVNSSKFLLAAAAIYFTLTACMRPEDPVIPAPSGQIIADHTVVDRYDDIPQEYIDKVKRMWLSYAGESHSYAVRAGLNYLEAIDSKYQVTTLEGGTPTGYSDKYLRASCAMWGDYSHSTGWIYGYGEEDWFTNATAVTRTKAGIAYCHEHNLTISALGFGWCSDMMYGDIRSSSVDPEYGFYWYGVTKEGPDGNRCWGLDDSDNAITGNSVNMNTYLRATQEYIDYCRVNSIPTAVFFTTGTVDPTFGDYTHERGYQSYIKNEYIRDYVRGDETRILFDYADILCYDDNGEMTSASWNGHTFPYITSSNLGDADIGHIGEEGSIRLAKAMWWMLARLAGWDGE